MHRTTTTPITGMAFLSGMVLGGLALMLLPERHKETLKKVAHTASDSVTDWLNFDERKDRIMDIFNENTAKARAIYDETRNSLASALTDLGDRLESLDENKYQELVEDTVDYIQEHHALPRGKAEKLKRYLQSDFSRIEAMV